MFEHYSVDGNITTLSKEDAAKKMNEISDQWEEETTEFGKLFLAVFDWAYKDNPFEILKPKLRNGGFIPKNEVASKKFGFDIYGDCFLKL